jgi:hypothetical protein
VNPKARYRDRADRLRLLLQMVDDPLARQMLTALAEALEEAADDIEEMDWNSVAPGTIIGESTDESEHFYVCPACGQTIDMLDFGAVLHHVAKGHEPLPSN